MKLIRIAFVALAFFAINTAAVAQGSESFENMGSGMYTTIKWTGDNGMQWVATETRGDQKINGNAACTRCGDITGALTAEQAAAGVGMLGFKYKIPFSDDGDDITVTVTVGSTTVTVLKGVNLEKGEMYSADNIAINATGDNITIAVTSSPSGTRLGIDDIVWTASDGTGPTIDPDPDPDPNALVAPMAQAATGVTETSFTANWTSVSNADSYQLYIYRADGSDYFNKPVYDTKSTIVNISVGTTYHYEVVAKGDGYEDSRHSNRVTVRTLGSTGGDEDGGTSTNPDIMDYYESAIGETERGLKTALHYIIDNHKDKGYDGLFAVYADSDVKNGKLLDMYSTCSWTLSGDRCGNYKNVCDCWNREHSIPQSWYNKQRPMVSDGHHIVPTDGKVNGQRSNYPFGECENGEVESAKALGRRGTSTFPGYSGTVFEPDDEYKGDFARMTLYFATRYQDKMSGSVSGATFATNTYPSLSTWSMNLFLKWHREDPVSQKEIDRNNGVYKHQKNRNPYIDYPELVEYVWGNKKGQAWGIFTSNPDVAYAQVQVVNTVVTDGVLLVKAETGALVDYTLVNVGGQVIHAGQFTGNAQIAVGNLNAGLYMLVTKQGARSMVSKFVVQ